MACARDKAELGAPTTPAGDCAGGNGERAGPGTGSPFQVERACDVIAGEKTISLDTGQSHGTPSFFYDGGRRGCAYGPEYHPRQETLQGTGLSSARGRGRCRPRYHRSSWSAPTTRSTTRPSSSPGQRPLWRKVWGDPVGLSRYVFSRTRCSSPALPGAGWNLPAGGPECACVLQETRLPACSEGGGPAA